jgi:two-component system response regulator GlrR
MATMSRVSQSTDSAAKRDVGVPESPVQRSEPAGRRREDRIVGSSEATRKLIAQASGAARSDLPVWMTGQAGSDKELVARAIHSWSSRSGQELEVLTCSAIPEALQGREVFGCAEGLYPAIPGAYPGALARAAKTTLLLDGVDKLRPEIRQALLQAIARGRFQVEGESSEVPLEARIVCATESTDGIGFGDGPIHEIAILPLDERPQDVLPLATHYLRAFAEDEGIKAVGFSASARVFLEEESWEGDVLDLRSRVREAVRLSGGGAISAEALMLAKEEVPSFKEAKRAFETRYVTGLLRRCGGNISRAARLAKKDRKDFYDVIRRTGVDPEAFRG